MSLVVEGVSKCYSGLDGPVDALRTVSFVLEPGEMMSIVGPNGAGKTTLLQVVAGVLTPTDGRVTRPRSSSALLEVGASFDPELSGRENLELVLAFDGIRRRARPAAIDRIAEFAGLVRSLDVPVKHYSDGMVARLSAAHAVDQDAELLVMDEAMSVGDASFERQLMRRVREMRDGGTVVLVATHSLSLARAADRCLWLREGSVVRDGPTDLVLRDYELRSGFGQSSAPEPSVRFVGVAARPDSVEPGGSLELAVELEVLRPSADLDLRIEARAVVGDEPWMRPRDPAAAPADVLVAFTPRSPLGRLEVGLVRATGVVSEVLVTSTLLEVTVVVVDVEDRVHDEISCVVAVAGRPGRPSYLLRAEVGPAG